MPLFIKESLIYKLLEKMILNPYNNSKLKKIFEKVGLCLKESYLNKCIEKYLNKKPYFLESIYYKIFRKIVKLLDKIANYFNSIIKRLISGSIFYISDFNSQKEMTFLSFLIAIFSFSYVVTAIICNNLNIYLVSVIMFISIIFLIIENKNWIKGSIIYKIFKSW